MMSTFKRHADDNDRLWCGAPRRVALLVDWPIQSNMINSGRALDLKLHAASRPGFGPSHIFGKSHRFAFAKRRRHCCRLWRNKSAGLMR